jgi:hypothetical protein
MTDWSRIAKFAGLLGSDGDGEVVNAARMIRRELKAQGLTMADLVSRLAGGSTHNPAGAARTAAERWQDVQRYQRERTSAWDERMRQEEERERQKSARRNRGDW